MTTPTPTRTPLAGLRVLIGEDHALTRTGISTALAGAGATVTGWFVSAAEGEVVTASVLPDVVLIDNSLPDTSGIDLAGRLKSTVAGVKVVLLVDTADAVAEALSAGADGVVHKTSDERELVAALATVAGGAVGLDAAATVAVAGSLRGEAALPRQRSRAQGLLSPREKEILELVAQGMSNPQIGAELYISAQTVKTHLSKAFTKLGTADRAAAVYRAVQAGVLAV